jgi:pimeloyl-ACP methyl ester carboxylesterase
MAAPTASAADGWWTVTDVSAIADALGVEQFAVTGGSFGGPLTAAARLPERVTRAACVAGVAPFDMPDFEWFAGMDAVNIEEIGWAHWEVKTSSPARLSEWRLRCSNG